MPELKASTRLLPESVEVEAKSILHRPPKSIMLLALLNLYSGEVPLQIGDDGMSSMISKVKPNKNSKQKKSDGGGGTPLG